MLTQMDDQFKTYRKFWAKIYKLKNTLNWPNSWMKAEIAILFPNVHYKYL